MEHDVVALTQRLVRAASMNPPGVEEAAGLVLAEQARAWGLQVSVQEVAERRANVIVRLPGAGTAPTLVYCGHLDTVPADSRGWDEDPLGGVIRDGYLWGRGAVDMKGGLAAMLTSLAALRQADVALPGDVVLAAVVGEEVDCAGSRHLDGTDVLDGAEWLVVGEPTDLDLVIAHKGAIRVQLVAHGKAAHGAIPELGANAVVAMSDLIAGLRVFPEGTVPYPLLGLPSVSVNTIEGGTAINVVPDLCRAVVDIRTVPGTDENEVLATIQAAADRAAAKVPGTDIEVSVMHVRAPVGTAADAPLIRAAEETAVRVLGSSRPARGAAYFSDASVLAPPRRLPTLLFGPGQEKYMHQPNERVSTTALQEAAAFLAALPRTLYGVAR
nr:M20 family metallopeptidase [Kibdelosporangium sp. MJ126-NF4]CEL19905.1 Acetylornithine deacetylase [Kibdelosporangium sp. MJ126-NF4]